MERILGVTKRYFQIFKWTPKYHYNIQIYLVFAIIALHNFICIHLPKEDIYNGEQEKLNEKFDSNEKSVETRVNLAKRDGRKINKFCDKIVSKMWQDYIYD